MAKQAKGKQFEECFKESVNSINPCYRLKDAPKDFNNPNLKFTTSNIADFIVHSTANRKLHFIELKETAGTSLPFANINYDHAIDMEKMDREGSSESIFFVRFSEKRTGTFCVSARKVIYYIHDNMMLVDSGKKSFSYDWFVENGILIEERSLRTNYRLNLKPIFG
jgi:penicillin-binding protein-related factor A (putative recombinase)